jgi:cellulose synthase operon protein C
MIAARRPVASRPAALLALTLALGCAGTPRAGMPGPAARAALRAIEENDHDRAEAELRRAAPAMKRGTADAPVSLAAALLARRALDGEAEARHLAAVVAAAPGDPLAIVALRRLGELAETAPARAADVDLAVSKLLEQGRLAGAAAYRARIVRATAAEVQGDHAAAARHRAENGAVSAWTLSGPYALLHALDFGGKVPPEDGTIPAAVPAPAGLPPSPTRTLPAPDGTLTLEGEPADGDVFALATDVTVGKGGRYLLSVGTQLSVRVRVDGVLLHERRAFDGPSAAFTQRAVTLAPGRHRLVAVVSRGTPRTGLHVALSREDGAPSDAAFAPPGPGAAAAPAGPAPVPGPPALAGRTLAAALEPALGPALARVLAARDALGSDRETAKALVGEARALRPAASIVRIARADVVADDPTLDDRVAAARAEADLREALRLDPGSAQARLRLAAQLRSAERPDDVDEALAGLGPAASRPAALAARARAALDRGLAERAEGLAGEALRAGGSCEAAELAAELAGRRGDVGREDEAVAVVARCRGGRERLATHRRKRGDAAGERAALDPVVAARPWSVEPGFARAEALLAAGDPRAAVAALEALAAVWPRAARVLEKLGDLRELAGDAAGARAARERALLLNPANLPLRRALALDDGPEVLADLAEDARAAIRAYEAGPLPGGVSSTMVLDASAIDVHPGGAATERTHQVIHVLDQQGVEQWGEVNVPPGASLLTLRTLKRDGRTLEPERAGSGKGSVSLAGLEPGDYLEYEWLRADRAPRGAGGYVTSPFYFQVPGARLFRSVYVVRAPAGLGLSADAHGMPAPELARDGDRELVKVERRDVPAFIPEPSAPAGTEVLPFLSVGTGGGREVLQRALGDGLLERTRPTEELRQLAAEVRAAAGAGAPPIALVRAAYARVAKDVLGHGGGIGEDASQVLSRGRGGRLVVLKAVLGVLGVPARIALVRPFSADPAAWRFPPLGLWSTPLLRVKVGAETLWLDPSERLNPFGAFPDTVAGCEALVLPEPGDALEVDRTPDAARAREDRVLTLRIALAADGGATITGSDRYTGAAGAALKGALERLDASERRQAIEGILGRMFRGVSVSRVDVLGEDDPEAPGEIRFEARASDVARAAGAERILEAPIFPARLASRFVQVARRRTPLLVPEPDRATQRIELVAPPGLAVRAGPATRLETPFGTFTRQERVEGATLFREERLDLARGRIPPERYLEFARFAREVDEAQDRPVVLAP